MDKIWIVFLFLGVFFIMNNFVKKIFLRRMASESVQEAYTEDAADKEDPKVFWEKEGRRREPENAEYVLPEEDFFDNEKTEFFDSFEEEFNNLSDEERNRILEEAGLSLEDGERE